MSAMASQITGVSIVCSTVCWGVDWKNHWPLWGESNGDGWISLTKGQWRGKCFPFMTPLWQMCISFSLKGGSTSQIEFKLEVLHRLKCYLKNKKMIRIMMKTNSFEQIMSLSIHHLLMIIEQYDVLKQVLLISSWGNLFLYFSGIWLRQVRSLSGGWDGATAAVNRQSNSESHLLRTRGMGWGAAVDRQTDFYLLCHWFDVSLLSMLALRVSFKIITMTS